MSKAFTKEQDGEQERTSRRRSASGLPPGAVNYMTEDGARRLKTELAGMGDKQSDRAADIQRILDSAVIVRRSTELPEAVVFGTSVEVRNAQGRSQAFRIVGVDEIGSHAERVSWLSPTGKALLGTVVGQRVSLNVEGESSAFTIVRIGY